jgi:hypothetical protein
VQDKTAIETGNKSTFVCPFHSEHMSRNACNGQFWHEADVPFPQK